MSSWPIETLWISDLIVHLWINQSLAKEIKYSIIHLARSKNIPSLYLKSGTYLFGETLSHYSAWSKTDGSKDTVMKPQLCTELLHPSNLSISWVGLKTVWSFLGAKSRGPSSGKRSSQRHHCIFPNCQAIASVVATWSENCRLTSHTSNGNKRPCWWNPGSLPVNPTVKACSVMSTARIKMLVEGMQLKWQW